MRKTRHPALEIAVFAAALLLAAFIARELWSRRPAPQPQTPVSGELVPAEPILTRPPLPLGMRAPRAELAVTSVPPMKLTRVQRRKPKPTPVPAPK